MVEVGRYVVVAPVQGAAKLGQFLQAGGHAAPEGVDEWRPTRSCRGGGPVGSRWR